VGGDKGAAHISSYWPDPCDFDRRLTLHLLVPDKKGVGKRISDAVGAAGGRIESTLVRREMRGMRETEIKVSFVHDSMGLAIVQSLAHISGIALVGPYETTRIERPRK